MNIISATPKEAEYISDKVAEFNNSRIPFTHGQTRLFKNYVVKEKNNIIAGINACIYYWGLLYIDFLFVDEKHRGKNLGSQLLEYVENEAISLGAYLSHLDTFDFQAKDFYLKHGYEIFGILEDCPPNHCRYYFKKVLA